MDRAALVMLFLFSPSSTQLPPTPHLLTAQQPLRRERGKKKLIAGPLILCALSTDAGVRGPTAAGGDAEAVSRR